MLNLELLFILLMHHSLMGGTLVLGSLPPQYMLIDCVAGEICGAICFQFN